MTPDDLIDNAAWDGLMADLARALAEQASESASHALAALPDVPPEAFTLANEDAVDYASDHAAELVTVLLDTTRDDLRVIIRQAVAEGWSSQQLANAVGSAHAFSAARAALIGQHELALAATAGNRTAWQRSGQVVGRRVILGSEHSVEDECDDAVAMGVLPLDDGPFAPLHPGCICDEVPVLAGEV